MLLIKDTSLLINNTILNIKFISLLIKNTI